MRGHHETILVILNPGITRDITFDVFHHYKKTQNLSAKDMGQTETRTGLTTLNESSQVPDLLTKKGRNDI